MSIVVNNLDIKLLKVPYYIFEFTDVIRNPFSIILFCYLGEINQSLYDKYLKLFRQIIVSESPKNVNDLIYSTNPHKRFPLNKNIPENSYLFTLTNGEFQDSFDSKLDLLEEIVNMSQEENPESFAIYYFLADFFKLSLKFYSTKESLFVADEEAAMFGNENSTKEVFFFLDDDQIPFPILEREIDGVIRLKSFPFKTTTF